MVKLTGKFNTLLLVYRDKPGMLSQVSSILQYYNINIAFLNCDRNAKGQEASMVVGIDGEINGDIIDTIEEIPEVFFTSYIEKLEQ